MKKLFPLLALLTLIACQPKDPVEKRIDQLISQMTLDEKVAQMTQLAGGQITEDYETLNFNTAISQMMIFVNAAYKETTMPRYMAEGLVKLINPSNSSEV